METNGDIFQDITLAINRWFDDITILEELAFKIEILKEKINRIISQIEYEGETSSMEVSRLRHVGNLWITLMNLLQENGDKRVILEIILKLFSYGELSLHLVTEIILKL